MTATIIWGVAWIIGGGLITGLAYLAGAGLVALATEMTSSVRHLVRVIGVLLFPAAFLWEIFCLIQVVIHIVNLIVEIKHA